MKNKFYKFLCIMLCAAACLSAFSLAACTDTHDTEKDAERILDAVEQSIVGRWFSVTGTTLVLNADGTFNSTERNEGTFMHVEDGTDEERGHYEKLSLRGTIYILFDSEPNKLYRRIDNNEYSKSYDRAPAPVGERVLTDVEKDVVGEYLSTDVSSEELDYSFNADGSFVNLKNNAEGEFYQYEDGVDSVFGHYYLIRIKVSSNYSDYRYYDFNKNSLYLGTSPFMTKEGQTRTLHEIERNMVGTWETTTTHRLYTFYDDGTVVKDTSSERCDFYLKSVDTSKSKGLYYRFASNRFTYDWIIFENDLNTAYDSISTMSVHANRM